MTAVKSEVTPEIFAWLLEQKGNAVDRIDKDNQTALYLAAKWGNLVKVKLLLAKGASRTIACGERTPVDIALINGHFEVAYTLLSAEPEFEADKLLARELPSLVTKKFPKGENLLHLAARYGREEILEPLRNLEWKPDFTTKNTSGQMVFELALTHRQWKFLERCLKLWPEAVYNYADLLCWVARYNQWQFIPLLLAKGVEPDRYYTIATGYQALHYAILANNIDIAKQLLKTEDHINCRRVKLRVLALAAREAQVTLATFKWILSCTSIEIDPVDDEGNTALLLAAKSKSLAKMEALLEKKANPTVKNKQNRTALVLGVEAGIDFAAIVSIAHHLVNEEKHSPEALDPYGDLLDLAVKKKDATTLSMLLALGWDQGKKNREGVSHPVAAARLGAWDMVKAYIHGKTDEKDEMGYGEVAVLAAQAGEWTLVLDLILSCKAKTNVCTPNGYSILHWAVARDEHKEIATLKSLAKRDPPIRFNKQRETWPNPTPVMVAAGKQVSVETFTAVLPSLAAVNLCDYTDETALMSVVSTAGDEEKALTKFKALAEIKGIDFEATRADGHRAISLAAEKENFRIMGALLPHSPHWSSIKVGGGRTLLHLLTETTDEITVALLDQLLHLGTRSSLPPARATSSSSAGEEKRTASSVVSLSTPEQDFPVDYIFAGDTCYVPRNILGKTIICTEFFHSFNSTGHKKIFIATAYGVKYQLAKVLEEDGWQQPSDFRVCRIDSIEINSYELLRKIQSVGKIPLQLDIQSPELTTKNLQGELRGWGDKAVMQFPTRADAEKALVVIKRLIPAEDVYSAIKALSATITELRLTPKAREIIRFSTLKYAPSGFQLPKPVPPKPVPPSSLPGVDILNARNEKGETAFFLAALRGDPAKVKRFLVEPTLDIEAKCAGKSAWEVASQSSSEAAELIANAYAKRLGAEFKRDPLNARFATLEPWETALHQCLSSIEAALPTERLVTMRAPHLFLADVRWEVIFETLAHSVELRNKAIEISQGTAVLKLKLDSSRIIRAFTTTFRWAVHVDNKEVAGLISFDHIYNFPAIAGPLGLSIDEDALNLALLDCVMAMKTAIDRPQWGFVNKGLKCLDALCKSIRPFPGFKMEVAQGLHDIFLKVLALQNFDFINQLFKSTFIASLLCKTEVLQLLLKPEKKSEEKSEKGEGKAEEKTVTTPKETIKCFLQASCEVSVSESMTDPEDGIFHLATRCKKSVWVEMLAQAGYLSDIEHHNRCRETPLSIAIQNKDHLTITILLKRLDVFLMPSGRDVTLLEMVATNRWDICWALWILGSSILLDKMIDYVLPPRAELTLIQKQFTRELLKQNYERMGGDEKETKDPRNSALHFAVLGKDKKRVKLLLEAGYEDESTNSLGLTYAQLAAANQDWEMVRFILELGLAQTKQEKILRDIIKTEAEIIKQLELLATAFNNKQTEIADAIIVFLRNIVLPFWNRQTSKESYSATLLTNLNRCLLLAAKNKNWSAAEKLLAFGALSMTDTEGKSPEDYLLELESPEIPFSEQQQGVLLRLLEQHTPSLLGSDLLYRAAHYGNTAWVSALLRRGVRKTQDKSPFDEAVRMSRWKVVEVFLEMPDAIEPEVNLDRALFAAAKAEKWALVKKLIHRGTKLSVFDAKGYSALHMAVAADQRDVVKEFLDAGANSNLQFPVAKTSTPASTPTSASGSTPATSVSGSTPALASTSTPTTSTPLMVAAANPKVTIKTFILLLKCGAKPPLTDHLGETALFKVTRNDPAYAHKAALLLGLSSAHPPNNYQRLHPDIVRLIQLHALIIRLLNNKLNQQEDLSLLTNGNETELIINGIREADIYSVEKIGKIEDVIGIIRNNSLNQIDAQRVDFDCLAKTFDLLAQSTTRFKEHYKLTETVRSQAKSSFFKSAEKLSQQEKNKQVKWAEKQPIFKKHRDSYGVGDTNTVNELRRFATPNKCIEHNKMRFIF